MSLIPTGAYINNTTPWWSQDIFGTPANIEVSTITVNPLPAGNILLQHTVSSGTEYNAPLIFQRPAADINAPSESLVMNTSLVVPTKPVNGEYITATKTAGTVYDDIAVAGLQVYGNQTTAGNTGAAAYITGDGGNLVLAPVNSVLISSLQVSSLQVVNVISTTAGVANSYTANLWMSSPILYAGNVSTNAISTSQIVSKDIFTSTLTVSTLNAPNFTPAQVSTIVVDTKLTLTSTLSLTGSPTNINLGLGDVIQGLVGGAATQALGVGIGGAALVTGSVALVTGRTSGGVNSNIFQTVNGSTQLQFSTIGQAVSSVFLTVNSPNPLTTPGLEISTTQGVAAGTYCVRSVGDPLYITNNVSSIQMYGQWVPVIQPTATLSAVAISSLAVSTSQSATENVSSLFVSSVNGAAYPPPAGTPTIPSTLALSSLTVNGNLTQSGTGTLNWGGNTMSGTQVVLARPTSVNATLTTTGTAFLNAGASVNSGLTVASGNLNVTGSAFVTGVLQGGTVQAISGLSVSGGISVNSGGIQIVGGNFNMTGGASVATLTNLTVNQTINANLLRANAISTTQISTNNINVFTINNQSYPPPSGPATIPSTLNASTINFDGGLTNNGSAPITTNTINTTNANVNFYVGNAINAASISTTTISTNTVFAGSMTTNTINATTVNTNNFQAAAISTNTLSTNIVRAGAISSFMISSANGIITSLNVSSVNGAAYPPGGGSTGIPSTLNASTINVNGGITIANGGIINNSFEPIRTGYLSSSFISTGLINADTVQAPIFNTNTLSTNVVRAGGVSTVFLSSQTITASNAGLFQISSLTGSIYTLLVDGGSAGRQGLVFMDAASAGNTPAGNIKAVGNSITTFLDPVLTSYNIQNGYSLGTNRILSLWGQNTSGLAGTAQFFSTLTVCANPATSPNEACIQTYPPTAPAPVGTVISKAVSTLSIQVSSINGVQIPGSLGVPIGSVTIWAGGTDNGFSSQNFNIPPGWLLCDGSFFLNSVFPALASVLGNKYGYPGLGPPAGQTALPDLTFAVPMGTPYRNYSLTNIPSIPTINLQAQTSDSAYNTTSLTGGGTQVSSVTTWYITSKIGPVLNYGTVFPGNSITVVGTSVTFPSVYVSSIIAYEGAANDTGFIVLRSVDGTSPIPRVPATSTIAAVGQGVAGTLPGGADTPYFLGSANVEGRSQVTHNQKGIEVGQHNHKGTADFNILGSVALPNTSCGTGGFTQPNYQPYVSSTSYLSRNVGTYTAPNFLNMAYIIRGL